MKSLSLIVCKILAKIAFLTFDLDLRSKVMAPNESPYMISYMSIIQMESLALMVTEILPFFKKCVPTDRPTDRPTWPGIELQRQLKTTNEYKWSLYLS